MKVNGAEGGEAGRDPRAKTASPPAGASPGRAPSRTATLAIEAVREAWSTLLDRMRERSLGSAAQLQVGEPVAVEEGTVVLGFANDFARGWADQRRAEIGRDLSAVLGVDVRLKCVRQTPREATPATEDPMLRAALETFRRPERILEVE